MKNRCAHCKEQERATQEFLAASDLLTRKQAAKYLGVSEQTLAVWKCTKRYALPVVKVGRLAKYRKSDLDDFITGRIWGG